MNQCDIVAGHIQSRLNDLNIGTVCTNHEIELEVDETLFTVVCTRYGSYIHDGYSTYGRCCYYSDPDFYSMAIKTVRMIVKSTPILHIYDSYLYMPSILSE